MKKNSKKFKNIPLIFDIENQLWKYDFGTFWRTVIHCIHKIQQFPLSMLILGQKPCFLGPTIFEIPQPNWYYSTFPKRNKIKPNKTLKFLDFGYSETNCPTLCNHFRRWTIVIWDKFLHQVQRPSTSRKNSRTIPPLHKLGPWWHFCAQITSWFEF